MTGALMRISYGLPWDDNRADIQNFRRWLTICLVAVTFGGLVMPFLTVPEIERSKAEELPPQLARILLEKPKPPPPPPPPPKPEVKEQVVEVPKELPKPKPVKKKVVEPPKEVPTVAEAQEKAAVSGLLAFKDAFADMRDAVDTSKLQDTGAIAQGAGQAATIDRSLLTSKHSARSAGVNVAALSRDTGGVAIAGRETTKVEAPPSAAKKVKTRARKIQSVADARERSIEEIRRVFDTNKGAIFAIYNRALRSDPTLQGKVLLELVIDPSGRVTNVKIVDSEMQDQSLMSKIMSRIRMFDFGKQDVATTKINYPVHFLPT